MGNKMFEFNNIKDFDSQDDLPTEIDFSQLRQIKNPIKKLF